MMNARLSIPVLCLLMLPFSARGADVFFHGEAQGAFVSNTFLDDTKEPDVLLSPGLSLEVDFARILAAGYNGHAEVYTMHRDLFFHEHGLFFLAAPSFGDDDQHEVIVEASLRTQRNMPRFGQVNLLAPALSTALHLEPASFLFWSLSASGEYRWFYEDNRSNSVDGWVRTELTFTAPTRTTISPRVEYGLRYYTLAVPGTDDMDQQLIAGLHLSQGLGARTGIGADYAFTHNFTDSTLVQRQLDAEELNFTGEEFLFSGHGTALTLTHFFTDGFSGRLGVHYEQRTYDGWDALDEAGLSTPDDRLDHRLWATGELEYHWVPGGDDGAVELNLSLGYEYLRQWSNDLWYDTDRHMAHLTFGLDI